MKTNRNGKIARLPKSIREELNHRIENSERGPKLLAWLNSHPDVQRILAEQFAGHPIKQQNLSEWYRGGYQDWLELQEKRQRTDKLLEQAEAFSTDLTPQKIHAAVATLTAVDFADRVQARLKACKDEDQHWDCLCEIQDRLCRYRREDFRAGNYALRREKWDYQVAAKQAAKEQAAETEERRQMLAYFQLQPQLRENAQKRGGSDEAYDHCAFLLELEHNLKSGWLDRKKSEPAVPAPTPTPTSAADSPNPQSETVPIIGPNPQLAPIALANDCTPEEFAARSNTPYETHRPTRCRPNTPSKKPRKTGENKVKQTGTN